MMKETRGHLKANKKVQSKEMVVWGCRKIRLQNTAKNEL